MFSMDGYKTLTNDWYCQPYLQQNSEEAGARAGGRQ